MKKRIRLLILSNIIIAITMFTFFSSENVRADIGGAKDLVVTNCGTSQYGHTLYKGTCTGNPYPACSPMICAPLAEVAEIK